MHIPPYTTDQATIRVAVVASLDTAAPFVMDRADRIRWEVRNAWQRAQIAKRAIRQVRVTRAKMLVRYGIDNIKDGWLREQKELLQDLQDARRRWCIVLDELRQHRDAAKLQPITARCVTLSMEG